MGPAKGTALGDTGFSRLIMACDKFFALMSGDVYEAKPAEGKADKIAHSATFSKNLDGNNQQQNVRFESGFEPIAGGILAL